MMFIVLKSAIIFLLCPYLIAGLIAELKKSDTRPLCLCGNIAELVNTRVVGGHNAMRGEFPYAVGLIPHAVNKNFLGRASSQNELRSYCGGTLITDRHVLTAAHCLKEQLSNSLTLDIGDYDISNAKDTYIRRFRNIVKHPDYQPDTFQNDIAVVELNKPVTLDPHLTAAWLPPLNAELSPGTKTSVYGWGRLAFEGGRPKILQTLELPVISNRECQEKLITKVTDSMICAGGEEGRDACIGDSGSGLTARIENDNVIFGVVSFGKKCALPHIAGVYTKVSHFTDWIYEQTKTASCQPCIASEQDMK